MASFSVTNSLTLRQNYGNYSSFIKKDQRSDTNIKKLNFADSTALHRAVRKLADYDFDEAKDKDVEEKVKAFIDTYNNTIESGKNSTDSYVTSASKKIKDLTSSYSKELKDLGISIDDKGYMSLSSSATKNISGSRFGEFFGKDSEYMSSLNTLAKRISRRVDIYA